MTKNDEILKKFKSFSLFDGIKENELFDFIKRSRIQEFTFSAGEVIISRNDDCETLNLLLEGRVRALLFSDDGRQVVVEDMDAPRILAPAPIFASTKKYPVDMEALSDTKIIKINRDDFLALLHSSQDVMINFIQFLSDKTLFLASKVETFSLSSLRQRLAFFLLNEYNNQSRQEMADILGVARPSVTRILADFIQQNIIKLNGRKIIILDKNSLKKFI